MTRSECPLCAGEMARARVPYSHAGIAFGTFAADVCGRCGEAFFTEESWRAIEREAKRREVWGVGRSVKVGYSGHSLTLRIPSKIAAVAKIKKGATVYVQPAGKGKLLIEKRSD